MFLIDPELTGTTPRQRFCCEHRLIFLELGLFYPTRSLAFAGENYNLAPLVAGCLN